MEYINRDEYLDFLLTHKDKQVIKVVSGVRRCGKSTLFEIYKNYLIKSCIDKSQIISINFEDISYQDKNYKELYYEILNKLIPGKMTYIFLDEVQNLDSFEKLVDSLFIKEFVDIYITGSNAYFMSGELATFLSGRYVELKMLPLSFKEYINAFMSNKTLVGRYSDYITFSSFPYTINYKDNFNAAQTYLRGIYSTIILKDVVQRYRITDVMLLERIASFMFDNIGNRISTNNIAKVISAHGVATNDKTVERYIQALVDSLLIYQVKRNNIKGKQILKTQSKYYVTDLGLRNLICGIKGQDDGHILENIVFLELLRRGYNITIGQNDNNEINFVAQTNNDILFVQVAYTLKTDEVYKREIDPLKNLKNNYAKIVLTMDEGPIKDDDGIKIIYALDWLLAK